MARARGAPDPLTRRARRVAGQRRATAPAPTAYAPPSRLGSRPEPLTTPVSTPTPAAEPVREPSRWRGRLAGLRPRTLPRWGGLRARAPREVIAPILIVVIVVCATLTGLYGQGYLHARSVADARADALSAGKVGVPHFASYNYKTFDADVGTADKYLTPKFRKVYDTFQQKSVKATAIKYKATVQAELSFAGVQSGGTDRVRLLVFLNQTTTNTKVPAPKLAQSRLHVEMRKVGGNWLIDQVTAF